MIHFSITLCWLACTLSLHAQDSGKEPGSDTATEEGEDPTKLASISLPPVTPQRYMRTANRAQVSGWGYRALMIKGLGLFWGEGNVEVATPVNTVETIQLYTSNG